MKGSTNAQHNPGVVPVTITPASGSGITVFHSYARRVGPVVQVDILFSIASPLTDTTIFTLTGLGVRTVMPEFAINIIGYFGDGKSTTIWGTRINSPNGDTQVLIIPSDITVPADNWSASFTYLAEGGGRKLRRLASIFRRRSV